MNLFALNGGALNGTVFSLVLATASINCSASVNALAIRVQDALAPTFSAASVVANATRVAQGVAFVDGVANAYPTPTHTQSAAAPIAASANVTAFVLRMVAGQATANCTAEVSAVVASFQGGAAVSGVASVSATATRVQSALAGLNGVATVTIVSSPTVYRMVSAAAQGTAAMRVEYAVNGVAGAYASIYGAATVSVADVNLVYRMATAAAECAALSQATATQILPGQATALAVAALVISDAFIGSGGLVYVNGSATLLAQAERSVLPVVNVDATAAIAANGLQNHSASASAAAAAELTATPKVTQYAQSNAAQGAAEMTATALRVLVPVAAIDASASLTPDATRTAFGEASATLGTAEVVVHGTRETFAEATATLGTAEMEASLTVVVQAQSSPQGTVELVADATLVLQPVVQIDTAALMTATAGTTRLAQASILGSATVYADTVTNPAAYDPPERTFTRQSVVIDFLRYAPDTEFRRAA